MKFFVPAAADDAQAERVYQSIAAHIGAIAPAQLGLRVAALDWEHKGKAMTCEVGGPMPAYFQTGDEPVLAIFDVGGLFRICTPSRGGLRGDAIYAGGDRSRATYFDE